MKKALTLLLISAIAAGAQTNINVTNYGAVGDAVQFRACATRNSPLITTTNTIPSSAIGDTIEVWAVGATSSPGYCQDMIAQITNVTENTNIYVNQLANATTNWTFATYGHDNHTNFQNAIGAGGKQSTNMTITVPAGTYLLMTVTNPLVDGYCALWLTNGGITITGAGAGATTLLGRGAWQIESTLGSAQANRGVMFQEAGYARSLANIQYPVVLQNMTIDGGVPYGNEASNQHYFPADTNQGNGWDITHDALLELAGTDFDYLTFSNIVFQNWRGEMLKSAATATNGRASIVNCVFNGGNATAINLTTTSDTISNCVFSNLFEVAEYYQAYSKYPNIVINCVATNITGNLFAINGGVWTNPPFIIESNVFYYTSGGDGITTQPADNLEILSNQFIEITQSGLGAFTFGAAGYQGVADNSNILVAYNTIVNPSLVVALGGSTSTDPNRVESLFVVSNTLLRPTGAVQIEQAYGWSTNDFFSNNDCSLINASITTASGVSGGQYALMAADNLYWTWLKSTGGATNILSYSNGSRFSITGSLPAHTAYALQNADAIQIPPGAQIVLANSNSSSANVPVYLNGAASGTPVILSNDTIGFFQWTNGAWVTIQAVPLPPTDFHVVTNSP